MSASRDTRAAGSAGSTLGARLALGAVGVVVGLYGAYLLVSRQSGAGVVSALEWLVGAAVIHDGVVAVAALIVGAGLTAVVRRRQLRAPIVVGGVVLATTTIVAIPMIGRFGARPDNPTLLDRHYTIGWLVLLALVVVGVLIGLVLARRAADDGADETSPGLAESTSDGRSGGPAGGPSGGPSGRPSDGRSGSVGETR